MNKKILILNSSPRLKGNSSTLASQFRDGARHAGAQVEIYNLAEMDIRPCDACDICQDGDGGDCILEDDMQILYPKLIAADVIVVASPVYWFTLSAQAKLFIDRWYALQGDDGNKLTGKEFVLILTYGDDDHFASGAINAIRTFQDMCRYLKADLAGIITASAYDIGEIQKQPEILQNAHSLGEQLGRKS